MFNEVEKNYFRVNKVKSFMLGDKDSDYNAGIGFGLKSFLLNTGKNNLENSKTFQEILDLI